MRLIYCVLLSFALATSVFAAGGGGGGGGGSGGGSSSSGGNAGGGNNKGGNANSGKQSTTKVKTCKKGSVYSRQKKMCVAKTSALVPSTEILEQAWVLAKSGQFAEGRELFAVVSERQSDNAEALNGLGYTNRKLGFFEVAFRYYHQALALDPNYLDAREYLGEGYAVAGQTDLAKGQLAEIAKRGGTQTEQYQDLAKAIAEAVKSAAAQ